MLSSLLSTITSTPPTRQANATLESLTEDTHTYGLLFPDGKGPRKYSIDGQNHSNDLHSPRTHTNASTDWPIYNDVDLTFPRDVRIFIAQAGTSSANAEIIFDSKPRPVSESPKLNAVRHARSSSRTDSAVGSLSGGHRMRGVSTAVSSIPENHHPHHRRTSSAFSTNGAFERRARRTSNSSTGNVSDTSHEQGREKDDIERLALSCMFENATSNYKGMSNKVHIVPLAAKPYETSYLSQSLGAEHSSSFARPPQLARKPSSLSKSHKPGDMSMPQLDTDLPCKSEQIMDTTQNTGGRRTVLVTRTFSISWIEEFALTEEVNFEPQWTQAPAPLRSAKSPQEPQSIRNRTFRSPMYAVTIVLQLPIAPKDHSFPVSRTGTFGRSSMRKDSTSQQSTMSFGSLESERRSHWAEAESLSGLDAMTSLALTSDVDDRVDLIGQHWNIISRTLTTLQTIAQNKILEILRPVARTTRVLRVPTKILQNDIEVKRAAEDSALRVVRGIRLPRARTGHGLWPAWRDEARWLANWSSGRGENYFFLILLSAFLGSHTDWLQSLAPKAYRTRFKELQRLNTAARTSVPSRTVIISGDKMAARRLIFLLAAFLPTVHSQWGESSPLQPGTSSFRAYSQSPPSHLPAFRQESLRRTINRRGKSAAGVAQDGSRSSSLTATSDHDDRADTATVRRLGGDATSRRGSDAVSIRSKLTLGEHEPFTQKSPAIISPTTPSSIIVKPHFARQPSYGAQIQSGHSRSSSGTSATLFQPLQRADSTDSSSSKPWNPFRYFSMGQRRLSSSQYSDVLQTTDEGLGIMGARKPASTSKLQRMLDEAHRSNGEDSVGGANCRPFLDSRGYTGVITSPELREQSPERSENSAKPIDVPLKMSLNEDDGVIDVEIPFGEFGSPEIFSPTLGGYHSGSSYEGSTFGQHSFLTTSPREPEHPLNVSGWLDKIHPDFTLQAVKPYGSIVKDIKLAMSTEPTPPLNAPLNDNVSAGPVEKWIDVCTTLVADANTFTVTRLKLRRLVKFVLSAPAVATIPNNLNIRSQYPNPYCEPILPGSPAAVLATEFILEEKFEEEPVTSMDSEFADVVGRVTGMSASSSIAHSNASSRSSSRRGRPTGSATNVEGTKEPTGENARDCQKLIIGRLESIVASECHDKVKHKNEILDIAATDEKRDPPHLTNLFREGIREWLRNTESQPQTNAVPFIRKQSASSQSRLASNSAPKEPLSASIEPAAASEMADAGHTAEQTSKGSAIS